MNISVPVLEKVAEAAKDFLQKVITPPLEEVGLLFADQVRLWRFKNQINIVTKAEEHLKLKNLKTKRVALKVLAPLLENASMEEDEGLQNKWAALLANTVSEGNSLETTLYSHILSQISLNDAKVFEIIYTKKCLPDNDTKHEIRVYQIGHFCKEISDDELMVTIDNLFRLRLIKEVFSDTSITITDLAQNFYKACHF